MLLEIHTVVEPGLCLMMQITREEAKSLTKPCTLFFIGLTRMSFEKCNIGVYVAKMHSGQVEYMSLI